jgi:hypothetical protein
MPTVPAASSLDRLSAPAPPGRFLSNGRYSVLITSAGTGFSTLGECRLNVWSGDRVEDPDGFIIYLRDMESDTTWSAGDQPVRHPARSYGCIWRPGLFVIDRTDGVITTRTEICVPSDDSFELRRVSLINRGDLPRVIELTSSIEVLLGSAASHAAHPAFSKLFIQTEWAPQAHALIASRRPRAHGESHPCMFHALLENGEVEYETDRARFLGRLRSHASPRAMRPGIGLSGTVGNVLDPILSLRRVIPLAPGENATSTFVLGAARDRVEAVDLIRRLAREHVAADLFEPALARESRVLRESGLSEIEAEYAQDIAAAMLYGHPALRCSSPVLERAHGSPDDLERIGVSWRRPFAVLHAERPGGARLLSKLLAIHRYWRALALEIDLLILCDEPARVRLEAGDALGDEIRVAGIADLSPTVRDRVDAAARMVVDDLLPDLGAVPTRSGS